MNKELEAKIEEILTRGVAEVIDKEHLKKRMLSGEKLRVKLGIDPTSPNLHLGRAVTLLKMKDLQDLGHQIIFIVGGFTAQIGDTSDKDSERPMLSETLVKNNMKTYLRQIYKIVDPKKTIVLNNSKWLSKLSLKSIGDLATWFSLAEFIARDNIKKRLTAGKRISLREILYPLMQGYDSVMVDADLELGGTDQRFNMLAGREIQRYHMPSVKESELIRKNIGEHPWHRWGASLGDGTDPLKREPQDILMVNLIEGTDGRKMSSSWENTINLLDEPNDMFRKVMWIPDWLIKQYFIHCTRISINIIEKMDRDMQSGEIDPRRAKLDLATEIVKIYHGEKKALKSQKYYNAVSLEKIPSNVRVFKIKNTTEIKLIELVKKSMALESLSEARRKIEQGGVILDDKKVTDWKMMVNEEHDGKILKVGKIYIVKIKFKKS